MKYRNEKPDETTIEYDGGWDVLRMRRQGMGLIVANAEPIPTSSNGITHFERPDIVTTRHLSRETGRLLCCGFINRQCRSIVTVPTITRSVLRIQVLRTRTGLSKSSVETKEIGQIKGTLDPTA
ncbi:MAG: hypothetical protein P8J33_11260, partial [Pirellulaceae bacterium]|nr:hypothetical protein [Pirellulaceae bacterium]